MDANAISDFGSLSDSVASPDRCLSQTPDVYGVSRLFLWFQERNTRRPRLDVPRRDGAKGDDLVGITFERQRPLPSAGQLQVDINQDFGVEERSVLLAAGPIDPVTVAERIETVGLPGVLPTREGERVDDALDAY